MLNLPSVTLAGGQRIHYPPFKIESTLPFVQLWDEEEEEEDAINLPVMVTMELIVAEGPAITMEDPQGSPP